jgi:hypothetical protein
VKKKYILLPFLNLYMLLLSPFSPILLLFTDIFLFVYWHTHISILKQINREIILNPNLLY